MIQYILNEMNDFLEVEEDPSLDQIQEWRDRLQEKVDEAELDTNTDSDGRPYFESSINGVFVMIDEGRLQVVDDQGSDLEPSDLEEMGFGFINLAHKANELKKELKS